MDDGTRLLLEARDGSRRALAEFVRGTQPAVWRFCAHLVGRDDADDATQETYIAAWRALPSYRGEASARTWLFVIARRSAERVARRRRRWLELADQAPGPSVPTRPDSAGEIDDLLGSLDLERRTALVLTQVVGLSYVEAAAVCECAVGTIRSRVARAREQLLDRASPSREARG
ncbi:MAG: polymerase subunit sigma [Acidimicrobiaceae bacterium]|nr:polymerase subunit sigma [Acidimicrobiaceae bacterium]